MSNFASVTIPLSNIERIQLYETNCKKTMSQVKSVTGADYILNGTLYSMATYTVNCHLKISGSVIAKPAYTVYGYAWDIGPDISMRTLPCGAKNYIACTPLIVGGAKLPKLTYDAGQGGLRGRSAIGIKGDRLSLYCTKDGTEASRTPEGLRDDLFAAGWDSAVMLDGGGSSQGNFSGTIVQSSIRKVEHWICVYLKKNDEPKKEETSVHENLKVMPYSLSLAGGKALSKNFKVQEFRCHDGSDTVFIADELVSVLQAIREHFGKPVNINSGYRTEAWNADHGGAEHSQHKYGRAADITISGVTPAKIAAYAEMLMPDYGGIGVYNSFCHIDVRATKSRWNG